MPSFELFVGGDPEPQARPRIRKMGAFSRMYSPVTPWRKHVAKVAALKVAVEKLEPITKPCRLILHFYMARPKSQAKKEKASPWCVGRFDGDNLSKAVWDALVDAKVIKNDNLIVQSSCDKRYGHDWITGPQETGVHIEIKEPS